MRFKVGDRVRVKVFEKRPVSWNQAGKMDHMMGHVYSIKGADKGKYTIYDDKYDYTWLFDEEEIEPVKNECIVIYHKGNETIALDKTTGKKAVAKCSPDDKYDFMTGAKLAFERLTEETLYNGKVVCVEVNSTNKGSYTKGKIYEFKDGVIMNDKGYKLTRGGKFFHSFEEWEKFTGAKFIELVE